MTDEPLYSLDDLWELAADLGMTGYEDLDYQSLMKSIIIAREEKLSGIAQITWTATRKVIEEPPVSTLDTLYDRLVETGQADGIQKLGPGCYRVPRGWL